MKTQSMNTNRAAYSSAGYTVMPGALDAARLRKEMEAALNDAFRSFVRVQVGAAPIEFRYVPMMCSSTPTSVSLVDQFAGIAEQLLGRKVLPVRAKGIRYAAETAWHRDSESILPSIGFLAYLEDLDADNGALRVKPGSHLVVGTHREPVAVDTNAGDVIAMDEHLEHASFEGRERLQWRIDYVVDPDSSEELGAAADYFNGIYALGWDGGYDVVRYPSYSEGWLAAHPRWAARLAELGVLSAAAKHERGFARV